MTDPRQALDTLDRDLVAILRRDGRAPLSKLAEILGVSRGTVQNRIDRMMASGTLLGFTIRLRQEVDAEAIRAVMLIEVVGRSTPEVIRRLRRIPEIQQLHTTNGKWDLVAEILAGSLGEFDRVLRDVRSIDGVLNSETSLFLTSV